MTTTPQYPGVYVEEVTTGARPIEGVATSTAAFVGSGPHHFDSTLITSYVEFVRAVGSTVPGFLPFAVRGFFDNGGKRCVVSIGRGTDAIADALTRLDQQDFSLLCCPDEHQIANATATLIEYCERRKTLIALLQPSPPLSRTSLSSVSSSYVAQCYPWLIVADMDGQGTVLVPPGGHVAGAIARTDIEQGIQKSPDGIRLKGARGTSDAITPADAEAFVNRGINVLRETPDRGVILFGARTASSEREWKYVPVRRVLIFLEDSIKRGLQWAVFEPNTSALWVHVRRLIEDFLATEWRRGVLLGPTSEAAFFVRCDRTTMTQEDLDAGRLIAIVGVAPVRPAEFVILRFIVQTQRSGGRT